MAPLREVKDEAEIAALCAAGQAADAVSVSLLGGEIALIGRTERDVSREIADRLIAAGHGHVGNPIVASGPNSASPHHTAGDRTISAGEPVVCDFGGSLSLGSGGGYWSDTTRTVCTGTPSEELKEVYEVVRDANQQALSAVHAGVPCQEIDRAARGAIEAAGYGKFFIHRTGHGIGMDGHEDPYIIEGNASLLKAGNAFSIEPGIYLPGRMGVRIEDIVLLDGDEVVCCNVADRALHIVEA
jgi:Xaa-Pro aminopeptidase